MSCSETHWRIFGALALAAIFAMASGCASDRKQMSPPIDLEKPTSVEVLEKLLKDQELPSEQKKYLVGAGDLLKIYLIGRDDILGEEANKEGFKVGENPSILLPLIGPVDVHGKSPEEIEGHLKTAYAKYIVDPQPKVIISQNEYYQVALLGAVNKPGKIPLGAGENLLDAIFKAGGLRQGLEGGTAPGRYLKIYRETIDREERVNMSLDDLVQRIKQGEQISSREEIRVPIEEYLLTGQLTYNIPLKPNDVIFVTISGTVSVQGRVGQPGVQSLGPSLRTLTQVITARGNLRYGAKSMVEVVRTAPGGEPQVFRMNLRKMIDRDDPDFVLQDGDQVFCDSSWVRVGLEVLGGWVQRGSGAGVQAVYRAPVAGATGGAVY